ncbi:MAG TPA: hypothetical protein VIU64_15995, partial [Polyangia bacterium]
MSAPAGAGAPAAGTGEGTAGQLVEVAVALPVYGTFTYRDPRPGARLDPGTQVVVPFGGRTITGFVLGPAPAGADGGGQVGARAAAGARARDIEAVVGDGPLYDEEVLGLCRWAAEYYLAPIGELLRAALPQGERADAVRLVRLTEAGARAAAGETPGDRVGQLALAGEPSPAPAIHPALAALAAAGGALPMR